MSLSASLFGRDSFLFKAGNILGLGIPGWLDKKFGPPEQEPPAIGDLSVQSSTYGVGIGRVHGKIAVLGNVIWLEGNQMRPVISKKKQGGKGGSSGQTVETVSYFATFAVALCDAPPEGISAVTRIWVGNDLIYNGDADDFATIYAGGKNVSGKPGIAQMFNSAGRAGSIRVYSGADDQMPDSRMEADIGAGLCPAFRGTCYAVLYDWPLEKYGNTIAGTQVKVELVTAASNENPTLITSVSVRAPTSTTGSDTACAFMLDEDGSSYVLNREDSGNIFGYRLLSNGRYASRRWDANIGGNPIPLSGDIDANTFCSFSVSADVLYVGDDQYSLQSGTVNGTSLVFRRGDYLVITREFSGQTEIRVYDANAEYSPFVDLSPLASVSYPVLVQLAITDAGTLIGMEEDGETIVVLDCSDLTETSSFTLASTFLFDAEAGQSAAYFDGDYFYVVDSSSNEMIIISVADEQEVGRYTLPTPGAHQSPPNIRIKVKYGIIARFMSGNHSGALPSKIYYMKSPLSSGGTAYLSDVVEAELIRSEFIRPEDVDVSDLATDILRGYRLAGSKTIATCIQPLQAAYPFDLVMSGYQIKAVRRGGSASVSIPIEYLDARNFGSEIGVQLESNREMDSQLPRQVIVKHLDPARDYDPNEQYSSERLSTASVDSVSLDMPLSFTPDEAAKVADVTLNVAWVQRTECKFKLPPTYLNLEPCDVVSVSADYGAFELMITEANVSASGIVDITAIYNSSPAYTSQAVGGDGIDVVQEIPLSGNAEIFLIDCPSIRNVDNEHGFGAAMAGTTSTFPGGMLFRSDDNEQTWRNVQSWDLPVTCGYARTPLAAHDGLVIDRTSTLQVDLITGELESITEAQMMTGLHWCAYGADERWELIRFSTATLQSDGSYIISNLLRGLRGTEWATGLHEDADQFIFLDDADTMFIGADAADLAINKQWRGIANGQTISDGTTINFAYRGVNLMPLSPVHGSATLSVNDWIFAWDKRTRWQGSLWKTGVSLIMGEASESYQIDIMDGADVVRTLTAATETVTYTSAQQVADFGSNQTTIEAMVYMISADVGRGFPLTITG